MKVLTFLCACVISFLLCACVFCSKSAIKMNRTYEISISSLKNVTREPKFEFFVCVYGVTNFLLRNFCYY